ncbi:SpoIIE family protein phosphatase [Methylomagnum sp.]
MRVLVVDNDFASLFFLTAMLRKQGHEPVPSRDGVEAYRRVCGREATLVICRWNTPGLTGAQLCRKIRAAHLPFYTYFIMLSVRDDKDALLEGMESGADDFLVEPVDPDELRGRIRSGMRILRLEEELGKRKAALEALHQELSQAYDVMSKDLAKAAQIQHSMLPAPYVSPGVRTEWLFLPSSLLAGDMIGYFPLDDDHLAFFQLDVCGHGVSSSLISFATGKQLRQRHENEIYGTAAPTEDDSGAAQFEPPNQIIAELNRRFSNDPESESYFLTMVYGIINGRTGDLVLSAAGQPPPLLGRAADGSFYESEVRGVPVGILEFSEYDAEHLTLAKGDRLFVFTDGIIECPNPADELFGLDRMKDVLTEAATHPISDVSARLKEALHAWHGDDSYPDDISLLILET